MVVTPRALRFVQSPIVDRRVCAGFG
jgi:hypothetical protein